MRIAVTGSSGFIGSRLVSRLEGAGNEVLTIDISEVIDVTNWEQINSVGDFEMLYHLAAMSYVPDSYERPGDFYRLNVLGTINALELCRTRGAGMIFASSYVYGSPKHLPIDEDHPVEAFNPYAQTKLIGEQLCRGYNRDFSVPVVIVRPFNIYGPGQNENFLLPTIINQAIKGAISLKDSRPRRDMIYVDDVVELFFSAMGHCQSGCEVFNAGYGESHSVREIVEMVCELCGGEIEVKYSEQERPNEIMETVADISKARQVLGWEPKVTLREGLSRMLSQSGIDFEDRKDVE